MKTVLTTFTLMLCLGAFAQQNILQGEVLNEKAKPLAYSSVVLLNPKDSTMEFFGVTNLQGKYLIRGIKNGNYLLQTAFLGYKPQYQPITFPKKNQGAIKPIIMQPQSKSLDEVKVEANYVPFQLKKDTIEFNTAAFKVKPDAMTEDLLKRLPGIEIDRAGNIKAFGENVNKVLVDGKEFFGSDPKVATRNVPADAIDKVQVYDKKSDESEFTGIDDGTRNTTLNLTLKEDKKNAVFGDVLAGGSVKGKYKGSGKMYKFNDKQQIAALGMINNVNQFGFSFNDYMNFSGGLQNMLSNDGSFTITSDNNFPVNFGSPVTGLTTSGAGGINYSYTKNKHNKVFFSYIGNGSNKDLAENTRSTNFTHNQTYNLEEELEEFRKNLAHRFNFGLHKRFNSKTNLIVNTNASLSNGSSHQDEIYSSNLNSVEYLHQKSNSFNSSDALSIATNGSLMRKTNNNKTVLKLIGNFSYNQQKAFSETNHLTWYNNANNENKYQQFLKDDNYNTASSVGFSIIKKMSKKYSLTPAVTWGNASDELNRAQGEIYQENNTGFRPKFLKTYQYIVPKLSMNRKTKKTNLMIALQMELGKMSTDLWGEQKQNTNLSFFTPSVNFDWEYRSGQRIMFNYFSSINTPTVNQLLPTANTFNPLFIHYGNPSLAPEYLHNGRASWFLFDQFTFTSLMVGLNASYTLDKINWNHTIKEDLSRVSTLTNMDNGFQLSGSADFSTAISPLGIKVNLDLEERYNQGQNIINTVENVNTTLSHRFSLSLENRKKKKLDVLSGISAKFTNSKYSIQESLNRQFQDYSWFGEIRYSPTKRWNIECIADVANYNSQGFDESYSIPLLSAEVSYYLLKNNRAMLSLYAFDLLNKNQIVQRNSELNYLREVQSNTIGQYFMLSFKFRLNKFGDNSSGFDIEVNGR
jgi:hypothetical protein